MRGRPPTILHRVSTSIISPSPVFLAFIFFSGTLHTAQSSPDLVRAKAIKAKVLQSPDFRRPSPRQLGNTLQRDHELQIIKLSFARVRSAVGLGMKAAGGRL